MAFGLRAHAQGTAASALTYGQSVGVLTLDPVHGAFTLYPAGYEAALCLYDGLLTFSPEMKIIPQLAERLHDVGRSEDVHVDAARGREVP